MRHVRGPATWPGLVACVLLAVAAAGCGQDERPSTFVGHACSATLDWRESMSEAVERFAFDSRTITDPSERKDRYLSLFDAIIDSVHQWRYDVEKAPAPSDPHVEPELRALADDIASSMRQERAGAAALPLTSFVNRAVNNGHLFAEIEKAQASSRTLLSDLGARTHIAGLDANCGRTPVVGDPSRHLRGPAND